jgi:hypothetical protein
MDIPPIIIPILGILVALVVVGGWYLTTWMRMRHGYPLDGFGKPVYPASDREAIERVKILTAENAQLRAEVGAIKSRLETVERIATDEPSRLEREIEQLR